MGFISISGTILLLFALCCRGYEQIPKLCESKCANSTTSSFYYCYDHCFTDWTKKFDNLYEKSAKFDESPPRTIPEDEEDLSFKKGEDDDKWQRFEKEQDEGDFNWGFTYAKLIWKTLRIGIKVIKIATFDALEFWDSVLEGILILQRAISFVVPSSFCAFRLLGLPC
mmetsp:Transcript_47/g.48  ORF Transcript_47/g.48 Transcript_47/m.48 type:complete len:168 (+) Transcript_47:55-558(+)